MEAVEEKRRLIILTGPTAVGKTELSIRLAKAVGGEIVSADSMQIYKGMDIGTAKVTAKEMQGVVHHLIDCIEPEETFHVAMFQKMAKDAMEGIYQRGHIPIITGGTGFYIQSVLYDVDFTDTQEETESRASLYRLLQERGAQYLHDLLKEKDPVSAEKIHPNNVKRVIRALEYLEQAGRPISCHNQEQQQKPSPYRYVYFVLNDDRQRLYARIEQRVEEMFANGLEQEARALFDKGLKPEMTAMQGIGYRELFACFEGAYSLDKAKELIKQNSRHFAKRQLTWFKRERDVTWMNYPDYAWSKEQMLAAMLEVLKEKKIFPV